MSNLSYALKYLGLEERKDKTKLIAIFKNVGLNIDPSTTPWCAAFANLVLRVQGKHGTGLYNARSFLNYGVSVKDPKPGDIVVLSRGNNSWQGHVTFFVEEEGDDIRCLGGNQADKVCYALYPKHRVLGYRNTDNAN